jgi:hypothetical protein
MMRRRRKRRRRRSRRRRKMQLEELFLILLLQVLQTKLYFSEVSRQCPLIILLRVTLIRCKALESEDGSPLAVGFYFGGTQQR